MMTRGQKKPGRGFSQQGWIDHHYSTVGRVTEQGRKRAAKEWEKTQVSTEKKVNDDIKEKVLYEKHQVHRLLPASSNSTLDVKKPAVGHQTKQSKLRMDNLSCSSDETKNIPMELLES